MLSLVKLLPVRKAGRQLKRSIASRFRLACRSHKAGRQWEVVQLVRIRRIELGKPEYLALGFGSSSDPDCTVLSMGVPVSRQLAGLQDEGKYQ